MPKFCLILAAVALPSLLHSASQGATDKDKPAAAGGGLGELVNTQDANTGKLATEAGAVSLKFEGLYSHAYRFIDPPVLHVASAPGAASYRWVVKVGGKEHVTTTKQPRLDMKPLWPEIPLGMWALSCTAQAEDGKAISSTKERSLRKAAGWTGFSPPPVKPLEVMLDKAVGFLLEHRVSQDPSIPPYMFTCGEKRQVWTPPPSEIFIAAYAALHHPIIINGLLDYAESSGRRSRADECRKIAAMLADHLVAVSTPSSWAYPNVPLSIVGPDSAKPGFKVDPHSNPHLLFVARSGSVGSAYMRVWRATGNDKYLAAARGVADTLVETQRRDGSWPLRVNPKSGEVVEPYTANGILCVPFFEEIDAATHSKEYERAGRRALRWMLANPGKTFRFEGQYEDTNATEAFGNLENWSAHAFARYLVAHRDEDPAYLPLARKIERWIEDQFVIFDLKGEAEMYPSVAPAVGEQYVNGGYPMDFHTCSWMMLCGELYNATGLEEYRDRVLAAACALTYAQCPDGGCSYLMVYPPNPSTFREVWYGSTGGNISGLLWLMNQPWYRDKARAQGLTAH